LLYTPKSEGFVFSQRIANLYITGEIMRTATQALRLVLLALLIQYSSPVYFSVITTVAPILEHDGSAATIHADHCSLIAPQLFKEKDETETETFNFVSELVPLIDFSFLPSVLTAYHSFRITPLAFRDRFDLTPPLFTLFRVFLI
jgi:hypothetical protein